MSVVLAQRSLDRVGYRISATDSASVTWDASLRPELEPDTLFLLDPDQEATWVPGDGGMVMTGNESGDQPPWLGGTKASVVAGRFRDGIKPVGGTDGAMMLTPGAVLPADQWTVEAWVSLDVAWSSLAALQGVWLAGGRGQYAQVYINAGGVVTFRMQHSQTDPAADVTLTYNAGAFLSGAWHHIAVTFLSGVVKLYVDGTQRATTTGVPAPRLWGCTGRGDGLLIGSGGYVASNSATHTTISDLRISRKARTPGSPVTVSGRTTITVGSATGNQINKLLAGGLHQLGGAASETALVGKLLVLRSDKAITTTPMKAGGTDGTHPSLGHSGAYSYDWQVWERDLAYMARLGMEFYWSVDAAPSILGGEVAPYSGTTLTTQRSAPSNYPTTHPNDLSAFATIAADFLYYANQNHPSLIKYAGVWNEPEGPGFGSWTSTQYKALYAAVAPALKAAVPAVKVGGPEIADAWGDRSYVTDLIAHCGANSLPLDFVSAHFYSGNIAELQQLKVLVAQAAATAGIAVPELVNGEHNYDLAFAAVSGALPFRDFEWFLNDWGGAFAAQMLIEAQRQGYVRSIYTFPIGDSEASGEGRYGLYSDTQGMWATGNAYDLWSRLAANELAVTIDADPNINAVASSGSGRTTVMLASLAYRENGTRPVTISGLPAGTPTAYVIDNTRSNRFDAGSSHQALETVPVTLSGGSVSVNLKPRSVLLLEIA